MRGESTTVYCLSVITVSDLGMYNEPLQVQRKGDTVRDRRNGASLHIPNSDTERAESICPNPTPGAHLPVRWQYSLFYRIPNTLVNHGKGLLYDDTKRVPRKNKHIRG